MTTPRKWTLALLTTALAITLATSGLLFAAKGGNKGKPSQEDPPTAPVTYEIIWLGTLGGSDNSAMSVNNSGEIVGYSYDAAQNSRATIFTATGPLDLNDVMADLISARNDGPWTAWLAAGINDRGQITGNIRPSDGTSHPFIYDPGDSERPRSLNILPQLFDDTTKVWGINNQGQIAGHYWGNGGGIFVYSPGGTLIDMGPLGGSIGNINDAGQLVCWDNALGRSWRYTPDSFLGDAGSFEFFPGVASGINSSGEVAGKFRTETSKGRNKFVESIYRAATPGTIQVLYEGGLAELPIINDESDVCGLANDRRMRLYTDKDNLGLLDIDTLVTGDDESLSKWFEGSAVPNELVNRNATGFPVICGRRALSGNKAFVLIPHLVQ